jgi:hypothetical protein
MPTPLKETDSVEGNRRLDDDLGQGRCFSVANTLPQFGMGRYLRKHQHLNQAVLLDVGHPADTDLSLEDFAASQPYVLNIIDRNEELTPNRSDR